MKVAASSMGESGAQKVPGGLGCQVADVEVCLPHSLSPALRTPYS